MVNGQLKKNRYMKNIVTLWLLLFAATLTMQAQKAAGTAAPTAAQLSRLGLKGASLKPVRDGIWRVTQKGAAAGYVVDSTPFAADVRGFRGTTPVLVYIDKKQVVRKVLALRNQETPEFFQEAEGVLDAFAGQPVKKAGIAKVDVVTGATYSSRGLIGNVRAAVDAYRKFVK